MSDRQAKAAERFKDDDRVVKANTVAQTLMQEAAANLAEAERAYQEAQYAHTRLVKRAHAVLRLAYCQCEADMLVKMLGQGDAATIRA